MINLDILKKNFLNTGIATDFDGTISAIKDKQSQASIVPEAKELLSALKENYRLVSVISGRLVKQLADLVGIEGLFYIGNHGAEYLNDNNYTVKKEARQTAPLLADIYRRLQGYGPEFDLDYKIYSLAIHYRRHPKPEQAEQKLQKVLEKYASKGLILRKGRMVFDLRPLNVNKGTAVEYLVDKYNLKYFVYVGDDRTDIDAFIKMDELKAKHSVGTLKIALISLEAPKDLVEKSELRVDSIPELLDLFRALL